MDWRVLYSENKDAYHNSALRNTIITSVETSLQQKKYFQPTILFSEWEPTVAIAKNQNYYTDVDHKACKSYRPQVPVLRRPSAGGAVFINEGYIVFNAIFPVTEVDMASSLRNLAKTRKNFTNISLEALKSFNIPAKFYEPDNIIVEKNGQIMTMGNCGQAIRGVEAAVDLPEINPDKEQYKGYCVAQGSIRYELTDLDVMLDVLTMNGHKLQPYKNEIRNSLADMRSYNKDVTKNMFIEKFLEEFKKTYNARTSTGKLTPEEQKIFIKEYEFEKSENAQKYREGESNYESMGVCYFSVNGNNIVKTLEDHLPDYLKKKNKSALESYNPDKTY